MAFVMHFQTKLSQGGMSVDQSNPTAKLMSGPMMAVIFGIMFYHFPSGIVLYWLSNSLISLMWYRLAK
jgi:membrane protein insertase Oxa1/YidC/SpoIIIJ